MRKSHLILLIVTAVMALCSAYSLAAINQIYIIDFEWYSQFSNRFISEYREECKDRWKIEKELGKIGFFIVADKKDPVLHQIEQGLNSKTLVKTDFNKYMLVYCDMGKVFSPEYRLRFMDIAQRGSVVEVKVTINAPLQQDDMSIDYSHIYHPQDLIQVETMSFPVKGDLLFIFKDQDGKQLYEKHFKMK